MTFRTTFALTLALTVLSACGGEEAEPSAAGDAPLTPVADAAPAAPATTGCPWLTDATASEALGAAVTVTGDGQTTCSIASEPNTYTARINVDAGWTLDNSLSSYENTAGWGAREPVEGLGERAALVANQYPDGNYGGARVGVEQSGHGITVALTPASTQADLRDRAVALARAVVAEM